MGAILPAVTIIALDYLVREDAREVQPFEELMEERREHYASLNLMRDGAIERFVRATRERQESDPDATIDFLVLSGGGDRGAFGSGFLRGWADVQDHAMARPTFDIVSGVSTGSFIAPFAFLGTDADYAAIDNLYRNFDGSAPGLRGTFFLPSQPSLAEIGGLEDTLQKTVDLSFAQRLVDAGSDGRSLLIQATNLDDGHVWVFSFIDTARAALASGDPSDMQQVMLASAGVPGFFPAQDIDGELFADGMLGSNILYGGNHDKGKRFGEVWKSMYPDHPIPTTRYWVIINTYPAAVPKTIQPVWPSVLRRGVDILTSSATKTALRHLYAIAELSSLRGEGTIEVRWVAVPQDWSPPKDGYFVSENMRALSDEGRRLGADPNAWRTTPP